MTRSTSRRTSIRSEPDPPRQAEVPAAPAAATRAGLGWRIAIVVWLLGFAGLAVVELCRFAWGVLRG
jgi:hypothetical protein